MANPTNPVFASFPVPPPIVALPFVDQRGFVTPAALGFLQKLWASIQGSGGILDGNVQNLVSPGATLAIVESALEQNPAPMASVSAILGALGAFDQRLASLERLTAHTQAQQPPTIPALPLVRLEQSVSPTVLSPRIGSSAVQWTPILAGSTTPGVQTYTTQKGLYVEIGPLVIAQFSIVLSALGGTTAGNVTITGLPFPAYSASGAQSGWVGQFGGVTLGAGYTSLGIDIAASSSVIAVLESGSALGGITLPSTGLSATSAITGGLMYFR